MNNQFSENLKKIRKEHNLSQEQLADELGVSRQAISKWESAVAYPEMDKIIALCDKFNLNIDDLLHKDIKEVKGEEESKKKLNNSFDDFLRFITNTINLFSNMNFKSKVKCIFEQLIIALILFISSMIIYGVLENLFGHFVGFLPGKVYYFVTNLLDSILIVGLLIIAIIIITHIFKTRYLDYYEKIKTESNDMGAETDNKSIDVKENKDEEIVEKKNKILFKRNENKIIIRDPKHSEYKFMNTLFKIIIGVIKFFSLCFGLFVAFVLICLFISFIASFLLYKTGFFFVGLLLSILSSSVITTIILLLILNFVFNRKNDKKKMIWSFISSLIVFGIGCGTIFIGTISFDIVENDETFFKTITKEYDMKEDLLIYPYSDYAIEYVKSDNNNIKVEYSISKYCEIDDHFDEEHDNTIMAWAYCENPTKLVREFIKNANEKKIVPIDNRIEKITVYTNQSNIDTLKNNWSNYLDERAKDEERRNGYESRINELEQQNLELQQKVYDLQEQIETQSFSQ